MSGALVYVQDNWQAIAVIVALTLTVASRVADLTKTDVDNRAVGFISNLFTLLGGHVGRLGGDPTQLKD